MDGESSGTASRCVTATGFSQGRESPDGGSHTLHTLENVSMKKVYDLVVANGSYTDAAGNEKTRWLTIGAVLNKGADKGHVAVLEPLDHALGVLPVHDVDGLLQVFSPPPPAWAPPPSSSPACWSARD